MKVFGIGLNKTGTTTLGRCMKEFGFRHHSFDLALTRSICNGNFQPAFRVIDEYESFEDWPWPLFYKKIDKHYPESRFILTVRKDSSTWFESLKRHADRTGPTEFRQLIYDHEMPHDFKSHHIAFYENHNSNVREYFAGKDNFIEVCWEDGAEWKRLAEFLNKPVPDKPFPHANKSPNLFDRSVQKIKSTLGI